MWILITISLTRWHKKTREDLTTQEYFEHFKKEQSEPGDDITVFRGLGGDDFKDLNMKMSRQGSISAASFMQKMNRSAGNKKTSKTSLERLDKRGLLAQGSEDTVGSKSDDDEQPIEDTPNSVAMITVHDETIM